MRILGFKPFYCILTAVLIGCGNENGSSGTNNKTSTDTNYSDSRRNSTGTVNTISGDSTATLDSAMHQGRQGQ